MDEDSKAVFQDIFASLPSWTAERVAEYFRNKYDYYDKNPFLAGYSIAEWKFAKPAFCHNDSRAAWDEVCGHNHVDHIVMTLLRLESSWEMAKSLSQRTRPAKDLKRMREKLIKIKGLS